MAAARTIPGAAPTGPLTKAQRKAAAQQSTSAPLAHKGQDPNAVTVDVKSKVRYTALDSEERPADWRDRIARTTASRRRTDGRTRPSTTQVRPYGRAHLARRIG